MAELSISETTTFRWSLEEDVAQYSAAGIPAIGVWRHKLSDCGLPQARALAPHGLKVSHLSWAGGFTGSDGRSYRESVEDAAEALRTAAELDAPRWCSTAVPAAATPTVTPGGCFRRRWPSWPRRPPSWP